MQFYIKSAIFFCCVLGYPVPLTPLTKLVEEGVNVEEGDEVCCGLRDAQGQISDYRCQIPPPPAPPGPAPPAPGGGRRLTQAYETVCGDDIVMTFTAEKECALCKKKAQLITPSQLISGIVPGCPTNDECAAGLDDCHDNAICRDTLCGFSCSCKAGYETPSGVMVGTVCEDVNECANGRGTTKGHNCDNHATCTNTDYDPDTKKGFTCTCDAPLYHGNGISCSDQDLYKVGDSCGSAGCTCPTGYVPTRQDVSDASQSDCQAAARFLGIAAANSCEPDDCQNDEIAYSNNSTRPKGCYHSCKNNKLYIAKNPSARTFYRTSRKTPVLADPSADCDSYIRLHLCQSKYL